jgi:hypothetical protein
MERVSGPRVGVIDPHLLWRATTVHEQFTSLLEVGTLCS